MTTMTFHKVAEHLEKLKTIYETLNLSKKEVKDIELAIGIFKKYGDVSIDIGEQRNPTAKYQKRQDKPSFSDTINLLFQERYGELAGTKVNYKDLHTPQQIIEYIDGTSRTKVMKDATALDLKLLYCLLTGEKVETKGTKNDVYEAIKRNIRARKRGKAFLEFV